MTVYLEDGRELSIPLEWFTASFHRARVQDCEKQPWNNLKTGGWLAEEKEYIGQKLTKIFWLKI